MGEMPQLATEAGNRDGGVCDVWVGPLSLRRRPWPNREWSVLRREMQYVSKMVSSKS